MMPEIRRKAVTPFNSKSAAYGFLLSDRRETFTHPAADTTARTWTIPANSAVPFEIGTTLKIVNEIGAGVITLAITTDTLINMRPYATGSITIAGGETVVVTKIAAAVWVAESSITKKGLTSKSVAYEFVLTDEGKEFLHPAADTTARTWTIPANSAVPFPVGSEIKIYNETLGGVITVAITTDTLLLMPTGSTGSVAIAASGYATLKKLTSTKWGIFGGGLT